MKITLFFCAGLFAEVLGLSKVSQLAGVGRRMPVTSLCFTVGAFGMIGLPPIAGFVSKWQLGLGGLDAGEPWVVGILVTSTLLNAAYFLPVVYLLWMREPEVGVVWTTEPMRRRRRIEAPLSLILPTLATAGASLLVGLFAGLPYSPLSLARLIAEGNYLLP